MVGFLDFYVVYTIRYSIVRYKQHGWTVMDRFADFSFILFQTVGTVFVKVPFPDNDPGLYVCGIPITTIWFGVIFLFFRAWYTANKNRNKNK